ncbi:MAG TPA: hypothetical protein VJ400_03470 [Thermoplasmata archaeon]|nr:hypothetical protein [Thermoplasmata archaeon]
MTAPAANPPDPASSPWLHVAAPVGKIAAWFLVFSNFLLLFAPLFFLLDLPSYADPSAPGGSLVALFADPGRVLAIADLVALIGVVVLISAMFVILVALIRGDKRVGIEVYGLGLVVLACLAAWAPVMAYSLSRARGSVADVDAAAATGGWSLAAVLLLVASLAYLFFTLRLEERTRALKLSSLRWPIYAAVNVLGSAAIAAFFQSAAGGSGSLDAFTIGLVLKVTLIPMLGVWAYRDLRDRFPLWARVPLHEVPKVAVPTTAEGVPLPPTVVRPPAPSPPRGVLARPLPPPPND